MNYDFYKFDKKDILLKDKYSCIELVFFEIFKKLLLEDSSVAIYFQKYTLQYHKDYKLINDANGCALTLMLETASRELRISQFDKNTVDGLNYDLDDSVYFGRMIGDFLIRNKKISVVDHENKAVFTACDNYPKYFNYEVNENYRFIRVAPIELTISYNNMQKFRRKEFSYQQQNYIYNPNDMCSYLGGYPTDLKVFKKTN